MKCGVCGGDLATLYFGGGWICDWCLNQKQSEPAQSGLLDRIKVLEVDSQRHLKEIHTLTSLLNRCLNTGLRDDKHRPLYIEVCRVLGVDPDKPWEEK